VVINTLRCYDLIKVRSGEILTLNGNFDRSYCRATLSFYPSQSGNRSIDGIRYQKVTYEIGYQILQLKKLLDLPGQQHFLVSRVNILKVYNATNAFSHLSSDEKKECKQFINLLFNSCHLDKSAHGLTGSSALQCRVPTSDFDWVLYTHDLNSVQASVASFLKSFTFDIEHAYRKYAIFTGLHKEDIDSLFKIRWRYFLFGNLHISINFVDSNMRADNLFDTRECGEQIILRGAVTDCRGCYYSPYIIPITSEGKSYTILTWIYLYNGAFSTGDIVDISGRKCIIQDQEYIVVEKPSDYIRKLIT